MDVGGFAIAKVGKKNQLVKIVELMDDCFSAVNHSAFPADETPIIETTYDNLLAYLGEEPTGGTAYGVKVEPYFRFVDSKYHGEVHLWRKIQKEDWLIIHDALNWCHEQLIQRGIMPDRGVEIHIRDASGKWAGFYSTRNGKKHTTDLITFKPLEFTKKDTRMLMAHEMAHHVYFRSLTATQRSAWHQLYARYVNMTYVTVEHIEKLKTWLDEFYDGTITSEVYTVKDLADLIDDEELVQALWSVTEHMFAATGWTRRELDDMCEARVDFRDHFPTEQIGIPDTEVAITEYATTSSAEFFAEAFMFWFMGYKVPERVQNMIFSTFGKGFSPAVSKGIAEPEPELEVA